MGNRGKPRGVPAGAAENLLPTGARRAVSPASGRTRAERRKLQRKVKRRRRRGAVKEIPLLIGVAVLIALVLKTFLEQAFVIPLLRLKEYDQYTTTHSLNVSTLAMALAEYVGMGPAAVGDVAEEDREPFRSGIGVHLEPALVGRQELL